MLSIINVPGNTPLPKHPCPPIKCFTASYISQASNMPYVHMVQQHKRQLRTTLSLITEVPKALPVQKPNQSLFRLCPLNTWHTSRSRTQVLSVLSGIIQDNLFSVYLNQYVPHIDSLKHINPSVDHNKVPLF